MAASAELGPGDTAPDFTLPSTSGSKVTLSSLRETTTVLLAFFPLAFTRVCTAELCDFSEDVSKFKDAGATVFGISVDSIPTLKEFKTKHAITVDLLSDFKREVCREYGTLLEEPFLSQRAYFIVDKAGVIRWMHMERELSDKRKNAELLAELEAICEASQNT